MEIDKTKGIVSVPPPNFWSKKQKYIPIPEDATQEEIDEITNKNKEIHFNNKICACTKPYFFGYIYDREMKKYKEHKAKYNKFSLKACQKNLSGILESKDCSDFEKQIKKNYYKYMPLKRNKSIMNVLTYYVEDMVFDNKWSKNDSKFDYRILMSNEDYIPKQSNIDKIKNNMKMFFDEYESISSMERRLEEFLKDEYSYENTYKYLFEAFSDDIHSIISNESELCDTVIYIAYNCFKQKSKDFIWAIFGEQIVNNLKMKTNKFCYVCEDDSGREYLGSKYKVVEVDMDAITV